MWLCQNGKGQVWHLLWAILCPPTHTKFIYWTANPQSQDRTVYRDRVFKDETKLKWGPESGRPSNITDILMGRGDLNTETDPKGTWTRTEVKPCEEAVSGHLQKPKIVTSGETKPTGTLILDFQPLVVLENKLQLFKPPNLWYCYEAQTD